MSPALLLDPEGALTDPASGVISGAQSPLRAMGREVPPDNDLLSTIGPPIRASSDGCKVLTRTSRRACVRGLPGPRRALRLVVRSMR